MKKAFLLIAVPALLVALGFAQTPAASTNADQTNIKGCLGGSDGNYTVVEDNTGHTFKISTSSVDLKPHLSHDVTLIGHRGGAGSAAADDSFAVTELNMMSERCAAGAAAPAATVTTPAETAPPPAADTTPPAGTAVTPAAAASAPVETVSTPSETASIPPVAAAAPAATTSPVAETAVTPVAAVAAPAATVSTPAETTVTPAARPRRRSETPAAATTPHAVTASSPPETVSTPAAAAATPAANSSPSSDPVSTPAAVATTPTANSRGWSLWLWIAFAVLIIVIGTMFPFFSRWRKQKNLERTGAPNLSFTRDVSSDQGKSDKQGPRKAA
jgi:hypothetical protein